MQLRYFKISLLILIWIGLIFCYQSNLFFWGWYDDAILSIFSQPILFGKCFLNAPGSDLAFINYSLICLSVALGQMHLVSNGYGVVLFGSTVIWVTGVFFVLNILSRKLNSFYKFVLLCSSAICLLPHLFFLNYTANAVLLAGIGSVLLFLAIRDEKNSRALLVFGLIAVLAGLLMRYQAALVALVFATVCLLNLKEIFKNGKVFLVASIVVINPFHNPLNPDFPAEAAAPAPNPRKLKIGSRIPTNIQGIYKSVLTINLKNGLFL